MPTKIRVLVREENGWLIAHGIELHIVVQCEERGELPHLFWATLAMYAQLDEIDGLPPLSRLEEAPEEISRAWDEATIVDGLPPSWRANEAATPMEFRLAAA